MGKVSGLVRVMAMLARYTLPDGVDASVNEQAREFCLACVDGLRSADDEMRRLNRERDQALDMLARIEAPWLAGEQLMAAKLRSAARSSREQAYALIERELREARVHEIELGSDERGPSVSVRAFEPDMSETVLTRDSLIDAVDVRGGDVGPRRDAYTIKPASDS